MLRMATPDTANRRALLKKHLLTLIVSVVTLDAIMIGVYYGLGIRDRVNKTQQTFVAVWVVLTMIIVTTIMKRIRQARGRR